ncbi:MAG: hypothetical protein WC658_02485, partial [Candidatus Omnitrophota bacterium]
ISVTGRSRWADNIIAILTTANIKKISFEMCIEFKNERTSQVIARGVQKVAFININSRDFTSIPGDMKNVIVNYNKET